MAYNTREFMGACKGTKIEKNKGYAGNFFV